MGNELEERVPADAVAKDFSQLAGHDHQSRPGDVARKDRLRQEIHHEPAAEQASEDADAANEQRKRRSQGERLRLALPWLSGSITVAVKTATVAVGPRASCREEPNSA